MFSCPTITRALLLLFFVHVGVLAEEQPCTIHDNGKYYDLNPLKASQDYQVKTSTNQSIWINACQNVRTDLFGIKDDSINAGDVGAFVRRGHGDFVMGKVNTAISVVDSRPRLVMDSGSRCKAKVGGETTEIRASSVVTFVCDTSLLGSGSPRLLAQLPPGDDEVACAYVIEWRTPHACPTSEGGFLWGFFTTIAIIILVLLMVYTILGTLYNRFVLQLRGFDQIPQFSIESMKYHASEAWDWMKDMYSTLDIGGPRGSSNGAYQGIPSGGLPTTNPISHFSQSAGLAHGEEPEATGDFDNTGFGNSKFNRPQLGKNKSASFQRPEINPISHQSQVHAAQSLSFKSPTSPAAPIHSAPREHSDVPQGLNAGSDNHGSILEGPDFALVDDDDAQELVDVNAATVAERTSPLLPSEGLSRSTSTHIDVPTSNPAAAARGRDLGNGDVTRL